MGKYVIGTKNLTKQYGTQKSVANLNICLIPHLIDV